MKKMEFFDERKRKALWSLACGLEKGEVDPDVLPLLSLLNSHRDFYTTSSCSGRIQLAATRLPGEKGIMIVIAKWHRCISIDELAKALKESNHTDLWLSVQGMILHVACRNLDAARLLLNCAKAAGLKHSGIQGLGSRIIVEVLSSDRVETPLRLNGIDTLAEEALPIFVERINGVLKRAKERMEKFRAILEEKLT